MKKLVFIATLLSFSYCSFGQDFIDNALLFSRSQPSGSARVQALGGSHVSIGGDYSAGLINPAGLGMYNRSEFTISPGLSNSEVTSTYFGNRSSATKTNFNLPGISIVFHHSTGNESGFLGGSFGISMSRTNNFNRQFRYSGENSENSIVDYFIDDAAGLDPESMLWNQGSEPGDYFTTLTGLAYNTYLIEDYVDVVNGREQYLYRSVLSPLPEENGLPAEVRTIDQREFSESKGSQNQWSISYGANVSDKFFVGATIGVTSIRYKIQQNFRESNFRYNIDTDYTPINNFETKETYDIHGTGVNFSLGAIYRPVDFLQIGASIVTPTFNRITDEYTARIDSRWNYYGNPDEPSFPPQRDVYEHFEDIPVISDYNLRTPLKISTGATLISKFGFITGSVEFVNYNKARYNNEYSDNFDPENQAIRAAYQKVVNYRVGAEYRYDIFRVRAGYNYMADPYANDSDLDRSIKSFSGGLGVRLNSFFIDAGAVFSSTEGLRSPYSSSFESPVAYQKFKNSNYVLTVGFTF